MATVASLERNAQLRIRDLICEDPIALEKWAHVVDDVVSEAVDLLKIKDELKKHDYQEAILRTLKHCSWDLVGVLRRHGLNSVSYKIATVHSGCNYSLDYIWLDVGELPHNVSGRDSELAAAHRRLSHHSNRSVDANIVCISGPPDCGKSTLARQYAFENCELYGGNVVWINAQSTKSIRASFEKLAAEIRVGATTPGLPARVYGFFKDRKCLFVFDGLQRMEDFDQFKPRIISPLCSTPYLLVTSREGGLAPVKENELRILDYRVAVLKSIEEMSKPAAELAKLISYLDPGKVTVRFLEVVFNQVKKSAHLELSLSLLVEHQLLELKGLAVLIHPSVQKVIRSSLSAQEKVSSLRAIRETHKHLVEKRAKDLVDECTAHRLHLFHFDLKGASLFDYFHELWFDLFHHSSLLKTSQQAYEILKNRLGEEDGVTIKVRYRIAWIYYKIDNYPEAIGILESLLPLAKAALDDGHGVTGEVLRLLAYLSSGDRERANQYCKEWQAWLKKREKP